MGLVSFAAIAILGLLPVGLASLRQSMNQTVEAQIVRSIGAEAVTGNFTELARTNYYDLEGQLLKPPTKASYTAIVTTNAPVFPGSTLSPTMPNSLTALRIELEFKANPDSTNRGTTNIYSIQIANAGK